MSNPIEKFMTPAVHTIRASAPLTEAHRLMREHGFRHLPVLEGGALVGVVSQRDLHLIETLRGVEPAEVTVEEAMSQDLLAVEPEEPLGAVAERMAERKCGSAVVVKNGHVLGIFTTVDALRALAGLSKARAKASSSASK